MLAEERSRNDTSPQYAIEQVLKKTEKDPELQEIVARLYKNFSQALLSTLPGLPAVKGLNSAGGAESIALLAQEALKRDPLVSKRSILKLQGQMFFRQQIEASGGVYTTEEVAKLLASSPSAVRKRRERGRLLAVSFGENISYPVWQFDDQGVIKHLPTIMASLQTTSPVGVVQFFLSYDEELDQTPIEALKNGNANQLETVKILAGQFNQQLAR